MENENYKLQSIKVFGSKENLYYNTKRYRKVYDESESRYLYCELAFYNKSFDEKEWNTTIQFICKNAKTKEQICNFEKELLVKKDMNIVYVREGWGTPDPDWWEKGSYFYEVFIDEKLVGTTYFYVIDKGIVSETENPYFEIKEINLFEGPKNGVPFSDRVYRNVFIARESKYINVEMRLLNLQTALDSIPIELQFYTYKNDSGGLKFYMTYFKEIMDSREEIIMDTGYGSDNGGYFYEGVYRIECVFMDRIIATIPFKVISDVDETDEVFVDIEDNYTPHSANMDMDYDGEETNSRVGGLTVVLNVPKELNNAFLQYLSFFEDYVETIKGKKIPLLIRKSMNGLELELRDNDSEDYTTEEVNDYLREYTSFLSSNINKETIEFPQINVENETLKKMEFDLLLVELKSEIRHFQNKYEHAKDKIKFLEGRTEELKEDKLHLQKDKQYLQKALEEQVQKVFLAIGFDKDQSVKKNDKLYLQELISKLAYKELFSDIEKRNLNSSEKKDLILGYVLRNCWKVLWKSPNRSSSRQASSLVEDGANPA